MDDLIDRAELLEWLTSHSGFRANCEDCTSIDCLDCIVEEAIKNAPAVEAAPVVHGRWVLTDETQNCNGGHTHKCGVCEDYYTTAANALFYCPRCGAVMDEIERPAQYGNQMEFVDGEWKRVYGLIRESYVERRAGNDPA